mgnify:CR=1 FL=1
MLNKLVCQSLINMKNASKAKHAFVDVYYNNLLIKIINILYLKGYILGFVYNNFKTIRVYLKYFKDKGLLNGLHFYRNKFSFSYKSILYLRKFYKYENIFYLISTSKGLLTLEDVFFYNLNIGGILYFYIVVS